MTKTQSRWYLTGANQGFVLSLTTVSSKSDCVASEASVDVLLKHADLQTYLGQAPTGVYCRITVYNHVASVWACNYT